MADTRILKDGTAECPVCGKVPDESLILHAMLNHQEWLAHRWEEAMRQGDYVKRVQTEADDDEG